VALPAVPSTIRVQWKGSQSVDLDIINRMYFQYSGSSPTAAQLNTMASTVATAWNSDMGSVTNSGYTLTEVIIEDLNSSTGAVGTATVSHGGPRGGNGSSLAQAMLVNFTLARRYRGGKPRIYLPPPASTDYNTPDAWTTGVITATTTAIQSFISGIIAAVWTGGGTLTQVNVSYYEGFTVFTGPTGRARNIPKLRTGGPQVDAITSSAANIKPANQRRRLGKR
jgi:hypothetical protein